jgi:hypothetical protein
MDNGKRLGGSLRAMNDSQERIDVVAITMRLAELCPKLIFIYEQRRKPLAIGIRDQIAV